MSRRSGDTIAKKNENREKARASTQFRGFVNHTLTAEEKRAYAQWRLAEEVETNVLPTLLGEGYRVSLSVDKRSSAYMAAISTKDPVSKNVNLVLTARAGSDPLEAACRAMFLHYYILEEEWPEPGQKDEYVDEWAEG